MRALLALLIATVLLPTGHALAAANPEAIEIPQKEGGGRLKALLFRPEGQGPFPAVVALHNCTGLSNSSGTLGARYRDPANLTAPALPLRLVEPDSPKVANARMQS